MASLDPRKNAEASIYVGHHCLLQTMHEGWDAPEQEGINAQVSIQPHLYTLMTTLLPGFNLWLSSLLACMSKVFEC